MPHSPKVVCVPVEPTEEMYCRGDEAFIDALNFENMKRADPTPAQRCYRAMLAASPTTDHVGVPRELLERVAALHAVPFTSTETTNDEADATMDELRAILSAAREGK